MRKLFLALPLAALLALSPAPLSPVAAQAPAGHLTEATGAVALRPIGGTWSPAPRGAALLEGQALRTGPRATAELDLGPNRLGLEPDTVLRIDSAHPATPAFTLEQGRAVILLRSLRPGQVGRVHLPGGSVTLGEPGLYVVAAPGAGHPGSVGVSRGLAQLHGPGVSLAVPAGQTGLFGGPGPATLRQGVAEGFLADDPSPPPEIVRPAAQPAAPGLAGDDPLRREGSWAELPEYGTVWYPPVAPSWNPYADPWQAERWGYAPYTSGAWIMIGPRWAWMPPRRVPPPAWRHAHPPPGAVRPHRPPPAVMAPPPMPAPNPFPAAPHVVTPRPGLPPAMLPQTAAPIPPPSPAPGMPRPPLAAPSFAAPPIAAPRPMPTAPLPPPVAAPAPAAPHVFTPRPAPPPAALPSIAAPPPRMAPPMAAPPLAAPPPRPAPMAPPRICPPNRPTC